MVFSRCPHVAFNFVFCANCCHHVTKTPPQRSSLVRHANSSTHRAAIEGQASSEVMVLVNGKRVPSRQLVCSRVMLACLYPEPRCRHKKCSNACWKSFPSKNIRQQQDLTLMLQAARFVHQHSLALSKFGFVLCVQAQFGRFKRRCLLACLGEAARKLTLLWLSLGDVASS